MNGIIMMVIAIVVLGGGYLFYGKYLEKKWGIDPNAKTPAYEMEDGVDLSLIHIQMCIRDREDIEKAYYQCHTDITIPYEELEEISVLTKDGKNIILLKDGRFVLPGTEVLNKPLDEYDGQ